MIQKRIALPSHTVNIAHLYPRELKNENTFLVFLHEALGSIGQWREFPQLLCDQMGINGFIFERQGHGQSDAFSSLRNARYLHDAAYHELKEMLEIVIPSGKKIILIGHSDGGSIALLYASKFPKNVVGVVTMAAHVIVEKETLEGIQPAIEAYQKGKLDGLKKYHGDQTEILFYAWANTWLSTEFKDWDISNDIQIRPMPALIIQGNQDQYGTSKQVEIIAADNDNTQSLLLEHCKHHPHLEKPGEVIQAILQWKNHFRLY